MTSSVPHEEGTRDPLVDYCDRLINDEAWASSAEEMAEHIREVLGYGTGEQFAAAVSRLTTERDEDRFVIDGLRAALERAETERDRLRTWQGIMSVVDERYPVEVFPVAPDRDDRDDGPRILSLLRRLERAEGHAELGYEMRNETMAALKRMRKERDDALAQGLICCEKNRPELQRAEAEIARLRPVVEAAEAWCAAEPADTVDSFDHALKVRDALAAAVDTYRRPPSEGKEST